MRNKLITVLVLLVAWGGTALAQEENSIRKPEVPGGDLNARGFTPLHEAARVGSLETAKHVIGTGANVNSRVRIVGALDPYYDFADDTPVDVAAACGHSDLVKLLRKHGGRTATELEANRVKSITWGKPVDGLQLGVALAIEENPADRCPTYLKAYVRNSGTEPRTFLASVHTGVDGGPERTSLLASRLTLYKLGGGDLITLFYQGENHLLRRDKNRQSSKPKPSAHGKDGSSYTIAALSGEDAKQDSITLAPNQQIGPVSIRYGDASKWAPPLNKPRPDRKSQYAVAVALDINHPQSAWNGALETAPLPRLRFNPDGEKGKTKTARHVPKVTGRVVKVDGDSITIEVRAMKRRGKVISPEREVTFKVNASTKYQRREIGGDTATVTDTTLADIKLKSLVAINKDVDSDTVSLVVVIVKANKSAQPPQPLAENGRFDVPYGKHERQVLDFYPAESDKPTPLVFHIHGGAWVAGDKRLPADTVKFYNDQGVSVVSINYRYIGHAIKDGVVPPVEAPLTDAARALQFVRSNAEEWNIDKERIGATGGSAGGCSSLWLAMHDDMGDPESDDHVARESTRLHCVVGIAAQTSLDPKELLEWMPNYIYGAHAFDADAQPFDRKTGGKAFASLLGKRDEMLPWIREYSPAAHASKDDPPITLFYPGRQDWDEQKNDKKLAQGKRVGPPRKGDSVADPTHCVLHGRLLQERFKSLGIDQHVEQWPGSVRKTTPEWQAKMKQTLVDCLRTR